MKKMHEGYMEKINMLVQQNDCLKKMHEENTLKIDTVVRQNNQLKKSVGRIMLALNIESKEHNVPESKCRYSKKIESLDEFKRLNEEFLEETNCLHYVYKIILSF